MEAVGEGRSWVSAGKGRTGHHPPDVQLTQVMTAASWHRQPPPGTPGTSRRRRRAQSLSGPRQQKVRAAGPAVSGGRRRPWRRQAITAAPSGRGCWGGGARVSTWRRRALLASWPRRGGTEGGAEVCATAVGSPYTEGHTLTSPLSLSPLFLSLFPSRLSPLAAIPQPAAISPLGPAPSPLGRHFTRPSALPRRQDVTATLRRCLGLRTHAERTQTQDPAQEPRIGVLVARSDGRVGATRAADTHHGRAAHALLAPSQAVIRTHLFVDQIFPRHGLYTLKGRRRYLPGQTRGGGRPGGSIILLLLLRLLRVLLITNLGCWSRFRSFMAWNQLHEMLARR